VSVIVVGAGLAGLACAAELAAAGLSVRVLERGQVVGGRLASKRFAGRPADIGAAYLTADDPDFTALVRRWQAAGLARPWTDTLLAYDGTAPPRRTTGPMRWAAPAGLRSLAEHLAAELRAEGVDVSLRHPVSAVWPGPRVDGEPADAVVLAMPGPQALRLLHPELTATRQAAAAQSWQPVLAAVLSYPRRDWADFDGAFVNDHPVLATVFDDGERRGDRAPVLVAHSTNGFAGPRTADPVGAGPELEQAVRDLFGLGAPAESVHVHRWSHAQPARPDSAATFHDADGVLLAGDAFGRPRVQTAWRSGRAAGRAVAARLA
jgi:predicted NAD/FAD-dependent oxidoreductase